MQIARTKTDLAANEWYAEDGVIRLREWGSEHYYPIPTEPVRECVVGAAAGCGIALRDPSGRVSRQHATLTSHGDKWLLSDLGSKNGLYLDGARRSEILLESGQEIGIGGVTLLAESPRLIALRGFLARLLGWSSERAELVDHALRSVRLAVTQRSALVLRGHHDLVPVAQSIHWRALGTDRPFVVCDPRRRRSDATVRSAESYTSCMEALAAAAGGSICVRTRRLPHNFSRLIDAWHAPGSGVQLILVMEPQEQWESYCTMPVEIPDLSKRGSELDQIIHEYADDAARKLLSKSEFPEVDVAWVRKFASDSLPEIEKATMRLVAWRATSNLSEAANLLGMAHVSLTRWFNRRPKPPSVFAWL
jgi:hypothetical protein